ncbi:MAG: histone deacetylase [Candidatus Cloacimonetes bacterium]|nr:histone deacetylase [Candidatus Cloacimonadota bacterium]
MNIEINPNKTGFAYHLKFLEHIISYGHPESPERLKRILEQLKSDNLLEYLDYVAPVENPLSYISKIHTLEHIQSIQNINTTGEIAELAVAHVLGAVKAVSEGKIKNAFCAVRPPGHHAHNAGCEEGFCYYNNIAIAARYAQEIMGHKKILIVDWDYHHGNGTQDAFLADPYVMYFSTHNLFDYPGTGYPEITGYGEGKGYNLNVPLKYGATDEDIISVFEKILIPKAVQFQPDFIFISAGFDSRKEDLLGCFEITDKGFSHLTQIIMDIAFTFCNGRIVSILEGGYNIEGLAKAVSSHIQTLMTYKATTIKFE